MKPIAAKSAYRFSRAHRLTTKADFAAVFDKPQKLTQGWFLALYKKTVHPHPRIGIIVSKRIIKNATNRNYVKRLIRESFRIRKLALEHIDLVILIRKGCRTDDKIKLKKELDTLWLRLLSL